MQRGELKKRADANYFSLSTWVEFAKFPLAKIGQYFDVRDGDHNRLPGEEITDAGHGIRYLRAQDLKEGSIDSEAPIYITRRYFETVKRSHIKPGYLLFSIMASVGNSAIVPEHFPEATANRAVGILVPITNSLKLTQYLFYLLGTELGTRLYNRIKKGGLQQRTNLADVTELEFPLADDNEQERLVTAMDAARAERRAKLAEADALLAGIDDYLLATLGLTPPPKDERKVFAVSLSVLGSQARLNADYFHPERILAIRALEQTTQELDCLRLEQVVDFIRDQIRTPGPNYLSLANVQSHTGELVPTDEEVTGACSLFQRDDVLFARLRPYLNKVHAAESDGCCSPEFHVLRVKSCEALRPDYLSAILRSSITLAQTRHMMTGNTHPRLTNEDVVNLVIPMPKPVVQEAIATEARRRREEARRLRTEAESGWEAAKRWFEEQLLGPVQAP